MSRRIYQLALTEESLNMLRDLLTIQMGDIMESKQIPVEQRLASLPSYYVIYDKINHLLIMEGLMDESVD